MKRFNLKILKFLAFSCSLGLLLSLPAYANSHPKEEQANQIIREVYHNFQYNKQSGMPARLDAISVQFLGKPYLLGALGEGIDARFDQYPRYRVDAFDCETYVTTMIALALGKDVNSFKQCLSKLRYHHGNIDFIARNHFTSLDWNQNNQQQGFVRDITTTFHDENNTSVAKTASALIDKPSWYQHRTISDIRLYSPNEKEQNKRLDELKAKGSKLPKVVASIPYIPLTALFDAEDHANQHLFAQIPNAAIIEIVRPNWNLREQIGTNLNVSHIGFAFWNKGTLFYREASSEYGKVVDVPLIDYLKATLKSPTIKGINVQVVVPQTPLPEGCSNNN